MTTDGYPFSVIESDLSFPRIAGAITFFLGIFSLILMISMAGNASDPQNPNFAVSGFDEALWEKINAVIQ
jgi:hypothetical protein